MGSSPVCFYCLQNRVDISICTGCRTRLEGARRDLEDARKQIWFLRKSRLEIIKENDFLRRELAAKAKGKR